MSPPRWEQVERLYHEALEKPPGDRDAFLRQACAGDDSLRQEIESLLAFEERAASFIETPPDRLAAELIADQGPSLDVGQRISHYEIQSLLSRGGMGEVYLARDSQLDRQVALKLLPRHFTSDPNAVARFEQEARAASALNHPNIVTIYEFGRAESGQFIVMEFVEGRTLRELNQSGVELPQAVEWCRQTAKALTVAHAARITHRDIKPENIMVRSDGLVKVLDFGLARLTDAQRAKSISIGASGTISGTLSGTLRYMSPEQARGEIVTNATDVFSLGIVLYELATGKHPFGDDSALAVLRAIVNETPAALSRVRSGIAPKLEAL